MSHSAGTGDDGQDALGPITERPLGPITERPLRQQALDATERETRRAVGQAGGVTYCADDDGYVAVDGYSEEIGWFRDLLALRYGEALVSPVIYPEQENARFTFFGGLALSHNPRWRMYWEIG